MKIYQIEISNLCNLTCSYCPHPSQERPRGIMTRAVFEQSLELLVRCGQRTAYLHNFGEPLLHPRLTEYVALCTSRGVTASFFTNGVLVTEQVLLDLAAAGLRSLYVSEHTKGEAARVRALIDRTGCPITVDDTFRPLRRNLHTWANQVRPRPGRTTPPADIQPRPCLFERRHAAVILWDGQVNTCCIDVEGRGAQGTVVDYLSDPGRYRFRPISLCSGCSLMRAEEDLS